jgi:predicted transcriptional regulator of viral defense system
MKYLKDFIEHFKDRQSFTIREARAFLKARGISKEYLHFLIQYCIKAKGLKKISRGNYTFKEDLIVAGFAFKPFYYGLHYALSLHGFWGQASNPVIITPKKVRSGVRSVMESNIIVRRIIPEMFFGFELKEINEFWVPVSSIEKTLIDFVYFRQKIPQEARKNLLKKTDSKALKELLKKCPKWVKKRTEKTMRGGRHWLCASQK